MSLAKIVESFRKRNASIYNTITASLLPPPLLLLLVCKRVVYEYVRCSPVLCWMLREVCRDVALLVLLLLLLLLLLLGVLGMISLGSFFYRGNPLQISIGIQETRIVTSGAGEFPSRL
jgi:hypothetical protein